MGDSLSYLDNLLVLVVSVICRYVNDCRKENGLKLQWVWRKGWVCLLVVGVH